MVGFSDSGLHHGPLVSNTGEAANPYQAVELPERRATATTGLMELQYTMRRSIKHRVDAVAEGCAGRLFTQGKPLGLPVISLWLSTRRTCHCQQSFRFPRHWRLLPGARPNEGSPDPRHPHRQAESRGRNPLSASLTPEQFPEPGRSAC